MSYVAFDISSIPESPARFMGFWTILDCPVVQDEKYVAAKLLPLYRVMLGKDRVQCALRSATCYTNVRLTTTSFTCSAFAFSFIEDLPLQDMLRFKVAS